ncbi:MAG: phosphatase PAP2 family protein [Saprospiraceae bacterium]
MYKTTLVALIFVILFIFNIAFGQSPYQFSKKQEIVLYGTGAAFLGAGTYVGSQLDILTAEEIGILDRNNINNFDRGATFNYSESAGKLSDNFLLSSQVLPLVFLSHEKTRKDFGQIVLMFGESWLLTTGITNLTKRTAKRTRPFVYNEEVDISEKMIASARRSFFSGHTSSTTANYFFTAKVFSDYFPDSKFKPVVWGVAITVPAITGYLRVKAGKHYRSDVISGYAVGALVGYFVPQIHKKIKNRKKKKSEKIQF